MPLVVIVTHRAGPMLEQCLAALEQQTRRPSRIIVAVSGPDSGRTAPNTEFLELKENIGYARAANAGLNAGGAGDAIVLNDDTVPEPTFIERLCAAATQPGLYQPCILLADGSDRVENTGHRLFFDGFNCARDRGKPLPLHHQDAPGACSGAAFLISGVVRQAVGQFDPDLEAFGEDLDLSLRAIRRGFPIVYVPNACVRHHLGATYGRSSLRKVYLVERNRFRLAVRSYPGTALATMPAWTAWRIAELTMAAARGHGPGTGVGLTGAAAALAGGAAGLWSLPDALRKRSVDRSEWTVGEWPMWRTLIQHRVRRSDLWASL